MTCGPTRALIVAAGTGLLASSLTHADSIGWAAALGAGVVMLAVERRAARRGTASCAVSAPPRAEVDA